MTPESPSDPPLRVGWLPDGPFAYTDEGEGPAVVALHGLPGSGRDYRWLGAALEPRVRLIRIDQPGFGGTPRATAPEPTLDARARFVLSAIDALGLDDYSILAHSMGGPLAMAVAARAPAQVRGLALLASVGLSVHRLARKTPREPDVARLLDVPLFAQLVLPSMRRGFVRAGFPSSTSDEAMLHSSRIFSRLSFAEIRREAKHVRAQTLIAWAEDDPLVEPAIALELAAALPPGPRVAFDDGGHNIQKTRAIELADALCGWTRTLP